MENIKEIREITRTNIDYNRRNSEAREKYRYLNTSHRNGRGGVVRNNSTKRNYVKQDIGIDDYDELKIANDFKRFVVSTIIVGVVFGAKIIDTTFTNSIEDKIASSIRSESAFGENIQNKLVYFSKRVGINVDGVTKDINVEPKEDVIGETIEDSYNNSEFIEENVKEESAKVPTTDVIDNQIADFYIDETILEEVLDDGKK